MKEYFSMFTEGLKYRYIILFYATIFFPVYFPAFLLIKYTTKFINEKFI